LFPFGPLTGGGLAEGEQVADGVGLAEGELLATGVGLAEGELLATGVGLADGGLALGEELPRCPVGWVAELE
jgi:hypothetical protein